MYELLVNVNGVPRDGLRARLAAARLLLPVLSLPAGPDPADAPVVPTVPGGPPGLTVLYPLVDTPHRLPTVPGEQTLLADDDLARSLAPDGRLGGLLAAFAEGAPAGSAVRAATCLAVDPDLVATAAAMRQGYAVRGPNGTVPGTGADVAGAWLDTLAAAARGGCVVALPFADADLVALARGQLGDLGRLAVADAAAVVTEALGTPVLDATTWPNGGCARRTGARRCRRRRYPRRGAGRRHGGRGRGDGRCGAGRGRVVVAARRAHRPPARPRGGRLGGIGTHDPRHRDHGVRNHGVRDDEPAAGHPGRGRRARVPRSGRDATGRRAPDRPRPAARVAHGQDGRRCAARHREPAARHRPGAGPPARGRRRRRADDSGCGPAPRGPAAGRSPRHPAHGARVGPRDACGRARPPLRRGARDGGRRHRRRDLRAAAAGRPAPGVGDLARAAGPRDLGGHGRGNPGSGSCATRSASSPRPARTRWRPPTHRCC